MRKPHFLPLKTTLSECFLSAKRPVRGDQRPHSLVILQLLIGIAFKKVAEFLADLVPVGHRACVVFIIDIASDKKRRSGSRNLLFYKCNR